MGCALEPGGAIAMAAAVLSNVDALGCTIPISLAWLLGSAAGVHGFPLQCAAAPGLCKNERPGSWDGLSMKPYNNSAPSFAIHSLVVCCDSL